MTISFKEKAGIIDTSKIFEKLHLTEGFIRNSVLHPDIIDSKLQRIGNNHFDMCDRCRSKKESFLPLSE